MGWVQGPMLKCPDRHPDDPDEHFAVVRVTGDKAEVVRYEGTLDGWRGDLRELIRDHYEHELDDVQLVQRIIEILARYSEVKA